MGDSNVAHVQFAICFVPYNYKLNSLKLLTYFDFNLRGS